MPWLQRGAGSGTRHLLWRLCSLRAAGEEADRLTVGDVDGCLEERENVRGLYGAYLLPASHARALHAACFTIA